MTARRPKRMPPRRPTDVTADRLIEHAERLDDLDGIERYAIGIVIEALRRHGEERGR